MGLFDFLISWGGTKGIIITLQKQNPEDLGEKLGGFLDEILDNEMGDKRSELIQEKFVPWFRRLTASFMKKLLSDQND